MDNFNIMDWLLVKLVLRLVLLYVVLVALLKVFGEDDVPGEENHLK